MAAHSARDGWRLLWTDLRARHAHRDEGVARAALLALPRTIADANMHAAALLRVVGAAPPPLRGIAQRCLLWSHGMYVDPTAAVGPGLQIPHPIAITLGPGVRIGGGVALYHNVTVRAAGEPPSAAPRVGDGAQIFTGAVICGPVEVGAGATVGAGTVVRGDVPAAGRVARRHGGADGGDPVLALRAAPAHAARDRRGLRELLASDHRARFGTVATASAWRLLLDAVRDRPLRVTTIVRVMHAGPRPLWRLWRRALLMHGCDIGFDATIGGGFSVPCPIGVCVGRRAVLGSAVQLLEHTTATPTRTSWHQTPAAPELVLGDGVRLLPGAGAFGDVGVRPGAIVGPWAIVAHDARAAVAVRGRAGAADGDGGAAAGGAPGAAAAEPVGALALLRCDLDRIASGGGAERLRAALGLPFQAAALMRAATSRRARLARIGRCGLRTLHHCYVDERVRIGPGLMLPLPCGIRLERGVALGAGVTIYDRVSLRSDRSLGGADGAPQVADGAVMGSGAVVVGYVRVRGELPDGAVLVNR